MKKYAVALLALAAPVALSTAAFAQAVPVNSISALPKVAPKKQADLETVGQVLQAELTELQNLALQSKQAHWNVSGTLFYTLHELLQEHYEGYSNYADQVAERMLSIGVSSDGRAQTIVETAQMPVIPGGFIDDAEVIRFFIDDLKLTGDRTRGRIKEIEDLDPTSANLLQEVEYTLGQYQWQFRAFAQPTPTDNDNGSELNQDNATPLYQPGQDGQ